MTPDQTKAYNDGILDASKLLLQKYSKRFVEWQMYAIGIIEVFAPCDDEPPFRSYIRGFSETVREEHGDMGPRPYSNN